MLKSSTRFVICSVGSYGDVFPFVLLSKRLTNLGYKVSFITLQAHEDLVTAAGIDFSPFGTSDQYYSVMNDSDLWSPLIGFKTIWERLMMPNRLVIREFLSSIDSKENVVIITHPLAFPLADLARTERIGQLKVVCAYLSPMIIRTNYEDLPLGPLRIPKWAPNFFLNFIWSWLDKIFFYDPIFIPELNKDRVRLGMQAVHGFISHLQNDSDFYIGLFPDWFARRQVDWPTNFQIGGFLLHESKGERLDAELRAFLENGEQPVVFTFGSENWHADRHFEFALAALRSLGRRGVFLYKKGLNIPVQNAKQIIARSFAPLDLLLPQCSAIVHHGGIGTMAHSIYYAIPQLVIPMAWDQWGNALRIEKLGIGISLPSSRLNSKLLAKNLNELLNDVAIAKNVQRYSQQMRSDISLNMLVDNMLKMICLYEQPTPRVEEHSVSDQH